MGWGPSPGDRATCLMAGAAPALSSAPGPVGLTCFTRKAQARVMCCSLGWGPAQPTRTRSGAGRWRSAAAPAVPRERLVGGQGWRWSRCPRGLPTGCHIRHHRGPDMAFPGSVEACPWRSSVGHWTTRQAGDQPWTWAPASPPWVGASLPTESLPTQGRPSGTSCWPRCRLGLPGRWGSRCRP